MKATNPPVEQPPTLTNEPLSKQTFDLYKHIKVNIKDIDSLCKDAITPESIYCFDCKRSSCPRCKDFDSHKSHYTVQKFPYYQNETDFIPEHFQDLDNIFALNPDYLNVDKIRGELKVLVDTEFKSLIQQLNKIKKAKMDEIDSMFHNSEGCVGELKKKIEQLKKALNTFMNSQKEFYNLNIKETIIPEEYTNTEPLQTEEKRLVDNLMPEIGNNDYANTIFLTNYDLLRVIEDKNKDIKNILINIKDNCALYNSEFQLKVNDLKEEIKKLNEPFKEIMRYFDLSKNHYKEIDDKIVKYNENIKSLKQTVFDSVNKNGTFEELEKLNTFHESKQKQNIENILNSQENKDLETMTYNTTSKRRVKHYVPSRPRLTEKSVTAVTNKPALHQQVKKFETIHEINLNSVLLQKFFTYLTLDIVSKNFRKKKATAFSPTENQFTYIDEFDEDTDVAKPLPGTNEVQLYDRKTRTITKKKVQLDKAKHKYNYFLNGCRSVVIKDRLYITGGVDKENKETNSCYVYYLKTNEIKVMPDMITKRAYHSIEFLESFKSILVVGGENNATCELYDMYSSKWRSLPELNFGRANSCIYLDRMTNMIYTCFGIIGTMSNIKTYSDVIECLELRRTNLGWMKVDYNNKAEMDFRNGFCRIFPVDNEKLLIYGASGIRESKKKGAIYVINKQEIVKIDNKLFNEIKIQAKKSMKLNKIISAIS